MALTSITLTYETLLATIRHHMTDPLIGRGKFGREERLADTLLAMIRQDFEGKSARQLDRKVIDLEEGASEPDPGLPESTYASPQDQLHASPAQQVAHLVSVAIPDWLKKQDRS